VLGGNHAVIYPDVPMIPNNAYLVAAHTYIPRFVHAAVGSGGGAVRADRGAVAQIGEAIDHLRAVAPRTAVPIHQAVLSLQANRSPTGCLTP
jgi:hypothetical protein